MKEIIKKVKELIPKNEFGIFGDKNYTARVDSLFVAKFFEKQHNIVLRDIRKLIDENGGLSKEFRLYNFTQSTYINSQNKKQPCYFMTRDGFTMLVMGYTGKKAMKFKEMYIKRFNEMEQFIKTFSEVKQEFPLLTENIKLLHDNPKPYHFSNECDMINRMVIGMTAKQYRKVNNIPQGESIRKYLTKDQIDMLELLQKVDVGLLVAFPDYEERKRRLEWYKFRKENDKNKKLSKEE